MWRPDFRCFLAVALAAHGVLLWCSRSAHPPEPALHPAALDAPELAFVELSEVLEVVPQGDAPAPVPAADPARPPALSAVRAARPGELAGAPLREPVSEADVSAPSSETPSSAAEVAEARRVGPGLSLEQMGIGRPSAFALPELGAVNEVALAEDRLQRSFAQAQLDGDEARGLGSHVLVTSVINQVATGSAPPRSKARFDVRVNADGSVSEVNVVEANSGFEIWQRVAKLVHSGLANKRLRHGLGRRVRLLIEVESKVQLPSGRSPGANVSIFGIPVNESEHEDSTTVTLLSPEVKLEKVPLLDPTQTGGTSLEVPVPVVRFTIIGVNGDPVDIGAPARQVVHSRLVKQDVL